MKAVSLADRGRCHSSLLFFKKTGEQNVLSPGEELELKRQQVIEGIGKLKLLSQRRLESEVSWYFGPLGLDKQYFKSTASDIIAQHIVQLYAAKVDAHVNNTPLKLQMFNESENSVVFAIQSSSSIDPTPSNGAFERSTETEKIEYEIEQNWLHEGYRVSPKPREGIWRVHYYRTNGTIVDANPTHLNFYFLTKTQIAMDNHVDSFDIRQVGDPDFLRLASQGTLQLYQEVMTGYQNNHHSGVYVKMIQSESHSRLIIAYRRGNVHSFFSGLTTLYQGYHILCPKKRVEQFANGMTIISLYLVSPTTTESSPSSSSPLLPASPSLKLSSPLITTSETNSWRGKCVDTELLDKIVSEISLLFVLPRTSLSILLLPNAGSKKREKLRKKLSIQEVTYAFVIWKFIYMFLANLSLRKWSTPSVGESNVHLDKVKERLRQETYTESRVFSALKKNTEIISELYANFSSKHHSQNLNDLKLRSSLIQASKTDEEIQQLIKEKCGNRLDSDIFSLGLLFNQQVVKSNFYKTNKTALAFRLSPSFLSGMYPILPVAVTYIIGSEFRGFHIRFRESGLGQIRIIHSDNFETFSHNASLLFEHNYARALIQHRRAKDIAEGGSMGTILLSVERQDKGPVAFKKYINSLLDLEIDGEDFHKKEDWIFIGPGEKTRGELMEWATLQAKAREHPYWRSFATGKSVRMGGFPEEPKFVMATVSTRQYLLGIIQKFGLKEEECTKVQISGPSHRLGASEITVSKDQTVAIVDQSGVIYEPKGLNRTELSRLVSIKAPVSAYDQTKLSAEGFFVGVKDTDKKLPDGTIVYSGRTFTETFHFSKYCSAQFFLPCEGEPNTINLENVQQLLDPITGKCRFQFIIEVVSMFFSDDARIFLEKHGAIFVKDSSSNKGSLISASLEVLVGLALTDDEYAQHMIVTSDSPPQFHIDFVSDVRKLVEENARLEFECLWREHKNTGVPIIQLSVQISNKINELKSSIPSSNLWNNHNLRQVVFRLAIPPSLLDLIGLENLQKRIPESYMRGIFSAYLASRYVYQFGLSAEAFSFYSFIETLLKNH